MNNKLTAKQSLFVQEYLIDLNATQAAIRAGYAERSAQQIGAENMLKPVVATVIQEAMAVVFFVMKLFLDRPITPYVRIVVA